MTDDYQIVPLDEPPWNLIGGGITDYNNQQAGDDHAKRLCFVVKGPDEQALGGVIGIIYWNWLSVDLMWLPEDLRRRGYGQKLLALIEDEARKRGAQHAFLDTFSFQAPDFYKKQGYEVYGELKDFPPGHQRYFMSKRL